jgi:hypothetical protein
MITVSTPIKCEIYVQKTLFVRLVSVDDGDDDDGDLPCKKGSKLSKSNTDQYVPSHIV